MKNRLISLFIFAVLSVSLLCCPAAAAESGAADIIEQFMVDHGLNETNFSVSWYEPETGESYDFNEDHFFVAGSMYKLPLAMDYYDRIAAGTVTKEDYSGGMNVGQALYKAIVCSDNDAAQALRAGVSSNRNEYRNRLAQYSGLDSTELPEKYYSENNISARFMMNTLKYLYENSAHYEELIEMMCEANPTGCFRSGGEHCTIAHKYGEFEGAVNDCAIVYADRPFLLVVFSYRIGNANALLGELCSLLEAYSAPAELPAEEVFAAEEIPEPMPEPTPVPKPASRFELVQDLATMSRGYATGAAVLMLSVVALIAAVVLFRRENRLPGAALFAVSLVGIVFAVILCIRASQAPALSVEVRIPESHQTLNSGAEPEELRSTWTLSFAGDCTIGTLHEWQGKASNGNLLYSIGTDYAAPLANVRQYFETDDLTLVNLEGTFTDATDAVSKDYRFRAPAEYAQVLTYGGVDAVSLANNHSVDYKERGKADTMDALEQYGLLYGDVGTPIITELEGGLRLGIVPYNAVEISHNVGDVAAYQADLAPMIDDCMEESCDIIVAFVHWGWEYKYQQEKWMSDLAHWLVEQGCDMVVGGHAHVLQPMEYYLGAPIFYSLGNFCYGGHSNPDDKDCALVQQEILRGEDGSFVLGELSIVPCSISSVSHTNDFTPTPYAPDSTGYQRVLDKMNVSAADGSPK